MIEFKNVTKVFGSITALDNCSFQLELGQIHAIVGENGAGKSTAMKILFGMYEPSSGNIFLNQNLDNKKTSVKISFRSPQEAMAMGIGMVHQHFMLAEPLTALDNILLQNSAPSFCAKLPRASESQRIQELAYKYGFQLDLKKPIEDLSVGEQQRVEILKVLAQDPKIIILDEPTAVLTPQETQSFFDNLRNLKQAGKTILIITHKLKEVKAISDTVTVLRAGKFIQQFQTSSVTTEELAECMVGRRLKKPSPRSSQIDREKTLFKISRSDDHCPWDLHVHRREIVGIAGVEGNGQKELLDWIYKNKLHRANFKKAVLHFGAFPEDRLRLGVLKESSLWENFLLGRQKDSRYRSGFFINKKQVIESTEQAIAKFDIRPQDPFAPLDSLSGGNQQKLVVARELNDQPDFILAAQPTRGVDIGAIEFIHDEIRKARDGGAGVLLISSELDELLELSDRIIVIFKGRLTQEFLKVDFDETRIGHAMGGGAESIHSKGGL